MLNAQSTAVSNTAQSFLSTVVVGKSGGDFQEAFSFTTGGTAYNFSNVTLHIFGFGSGSASGFSMSLYSGIGSSGPTVLVTAMSGNSAPTSSANYTYTPTAPITLGTSSTYWLVASATSTATGTAFSLNGTASTNEDGGALSGWSIGDSRWVSNDAGATWSDGVTPVVQFSVQVTAIPEPSTYAALLGIAALGGAARRHRRVKIFS